MRDRIRQQRGNYPPLPLPGQGRPASQLSQSSGTSSAEFSGKQSNERILSRRTVIVGIAGLAGLTTGAGAIWWRLSPRLLYTYRGHSSSYVLAVAWSPGGTRIASGSFDETVQVWDATSGGQAFTYRGHSDSVFAVGWSPGGTRIASGGADQTIQVWDASNGKARFSYRGHDGTVSALAWSPDGTRIASASGDQTVQVWVAHASPRGAGIKPYRSGMPLRAVTSLPIAAMPMPCLPWAGRPMARASPRRAQTRPYRSGMPSQGATPSPIVGIPIGYGQ